MSNHFLKILKFTFIFLIVNNITICYAQQNDVNNVDQNNLAFLICNKVDSLFESDFLIKNGRYFISEFSRTKGHPYFNTNQWTIGSLTLIDKTYPNISLKLDLYHGKLICLIKNKNKEDMPITLNNQIVEKFNIGEHGFVNCNSLSTLPQSGFYEVIYDKDNFKVYAKWSKYYLDYASVEYSGIFEDQKQKFFILKNGKINEITSEREFLNLFGDNKNEVKSYIKQNKIKFFKSDNKELLKLFQFTEKLS
jgi:hypothetical protein